MITDDGFNRWSQVVRSPGSVRVHSHCAIDVPPIGGVTDEAPARPGVRLFTSPVAGGPQLYTIDITSTQAMAMLEGFLGMGVHVGKVITWRARGFGVLRKDTIGIAPGSSS